ncbi:MAG: DegT/DnrJ/EryC1/StrS family aminotransferase [Candidatus Brocadiia bacterium]
MSKNSNLAAHGGEPVRSDPMPPRALFGEEEKDAAISLFDESIQSGAPFGYNGPQEEAFEQEFADILGGGFADGVNSGTSAVFVSLAALQLPRGSEVVIPPITDPGGAMPVALLNCIPVCADCDPSSYNLGPEQLEAVVTPRTSAAVVAHIAGEPVEMDGVLDIAEKHDIRIVEDCAQGHGATYGGQPVGTFGDIAAFSTMSGKHIASGAQGGMAFTRDEDLYWKAKRLADRGKPFGLEDAGGNVAPSLNLNQNDLGAAIGRVQLQKLAEIVEKRRKIVSKIEDQIAELETVSIGWQPEKAKSSYWFLRITLETEKLTVNKDEFVDALAAEGIPVNASYRHIPCEAPWYADRQNRWCPWDFAKRNDLRTELPNAIAVTNTNFNIAVHENYTEKEAEDIAAALAKVEKAFLN